MGNQVKKRGFLPLLMEKLKFLVTVRPEFDLQP